jgi:hypothetical protein
MSVYSAFLKVSGGLTKPTTVSLAWTAHTQEQDAATAPLAGVTSMVLIPMYKRTVLQFVFQMTCRTHSEV